MKRICIAALALWLATTLTADTVILFDGREIKGRVTSPDGALTVVIDTPTGELSYSKTVVTQIIRGDVAVHPPTSSVKPASQPVSDFVPCQDCQGTGKIKCPVCSAKGLMGWLPCPKCNGNWKGTQICRFCNGKGGTSDAGRYGNGSPVITKCSHCNGTGRLQDNGLPPNRGPYGPIPNPTAPPMGDCSLCRDSQFPGKIQCTNCAGTGKVVCPVCQGLKKVANANTPVVQGSQPDNKSPDKPLSIGNALDEYRKQHVSTEGMTSAQIQAAEEKEQEWKKSLQSKAAEVTVQVDDVTSSKMVGEVGNKSDYTISGQMNADGRMIAITARCTGNQKDDLLKIRVGQVVVLSGFLEDISDRRISMVDCRLVPTR